MITQTQTKGGMYAAGSFAAIALELFRAAGAFLQRLRARLRQRSQARAAYSVLRRLDDRTLRDLGFYRSELMSVSAEVSGEAESTRVLSGKRARTIRGRLFGG